jgi:hypothetical protein
MTESDFSDWSSSDSSGLTRALDLACAPAAAAPAAPAAPAALAAPAAPAAPAVPGPPDAPALPRRGAARRVRTRHRLTEADNAKFSFAAKTVKNIKKRLVRPDRWIASE